MQLASEVTHTHTRTHIHTYCQLKIDQRLLIALRMWYTINVQSNSSGLNSESWIFKLNSFIALERVENYAICGRLGFMEELA